MKHDKKQLRAIVLSLMLPMAAHAEVLVVEGQDSLAMVDEHQAMVDAPLAKAQIDEGMQEQADAASAPAHAVTDEQPFAVDNEQPDKTLNTANVNANLLDKVQSLQQEIQELRGQLEVQNHDLNLLKEQQLAFYKDVDGRLSQTATRAVRKENATEIDAAAALKQDLKDAPVRALSPEDNKVQALNKASRVNPADEQISYLAAYDLVKSKRYDDAIKAMQNFIVLYPQGGYTANAQYWLGELYMTKNQYDQAIEHFEMVTEKFPTSSKAADSLLKVGFALAASGKNDEARLKLQQVVKNYPDTQTATKAKSKLETLNQL